MDASASDPTLPPGLNPPSATPAEPDDPFALVGTVVEGRYLVERFVGCGGYGVVYRAQHLRLASPIALKVLRVSEALSAERRALVIDRFAVEGKLAFGLGGAHPAIARVLESGLVTLPGGCALPLPYLALEWLDGSSLAERLRVWRREGRLPLSLSATVQLLTPIAEALAAAHARGIAHRDVKPANIMLARRGSEESAVLLDFGLAKASVLGASTSEQFEHSEEGTSAFTPRYAAPEQWLRRLGATGPWTDVHALALLCSELLSGHPPYLAEDTQQLLAACVDPEVRPVPRGRGVPCAPAVEAVLERALRVAPRERFRDARAFWSALQAAAAASDQAPVASRGTSVELLAETSATTRPTPHAPLRAWLRSRVAPALAAVAVLLAGFRPGLPLVPSEGQHAAPARPGSTSAPAASDPAELATPTPTAAPPALETPNKKPALPRPAAPRATALTGAAPAPSAVPSSSTGVARVDVDPPATKQEAAEPANAASEAPPMPAKSLNILDSDAFSLRK